ncbi:AraC family transcriptional regulator [Dyadobacter sp. CY326]|nr:AraC family transcriptional regulator [Dyadobacter sp. CY326]
MKKKYNPIVIESISELHRMHGIAQVEHPLVSVVRFDEIFYSPTDYSDGCVLNFYVIAVKRDFNGKVRYGQNYYDFDEGVLSFIAPGQICYEEVGDRPASGFMLLFHPDFLLGHPLATEIKNYKFFSYAVNEALYLSKKEENTIYGVLENIEQEYKSNIDSFSQRVIISQIEVLLNYADRFYHRQFITRKAASNDLLVKLEELLEAHFNNNLNLALPTVKDVALKLNVSPDYLSDMLRTHTGQNTQQHIHNKLIEKAKGVLSTTNLSIAEIAYQLGFEHPQSFNKIFKRKTNLSPLEFRQSFN